MSAALTSNSLDNIPDERVNFQDTSPIPLNCVVSAATSALFMGGFAFLVMHKGLKFSKKTSLIGAGALGGIMLSSPWWSRALWNRGVDAGYTQALKEREKKMADKGDS